MTFFHGLKFNESVTGVRPLLEKSTAIIGLIATATAEVGAAATALDVAYPVNRPILITNTRAAIAAAGTGGTLAPALRSIADQGTPIVIVVRVPVGTDAATTTTNIIGGLVDGLLYRHQSCWQRFHPYHSTTPRPITRACRTA